MYRLALIVMLLTAAFGQTSSVPYALNDGPSFTNSEKPVSYPGSYSSFRSVNFRNLFRHQREGPFDNYSERLESIYYLGRSASSREESMLVEFSWIDGGGSSSQGGIARVFTLSNGRMRMIQEMGWDTHFDAGQATDSFNANTRTLVIRTAHYVPGDAHCCVSAMDVITLRWNGTHFVQTDLQTELSGYGKKEGKTLPH